MTNDSMTPEIRVNDVQIIEPSKPPAPGDYVAVKIIGKNEVIICQYKKLVGANKFSENYSPMCAAAIYWAMIPKVIYGSSIAFLHELFGRQIQLDAKEILSKTPDFYSCYLIGKVMEDDCNQLFIKAKTLRNLQNI